MRRLRLIGYMLAVDFALALIIFPLAYAFGQVSPVTGTIDLMKPLPSAVSWVCSNQDTVVGLLTAIGVASVISWFRGWFVTKLPVPVQHFINFVALNWRQIAVDAGAIAKTLVLVSVLSFTLTACSLFQSNPSTPVTQATVQADMNKVTWYLQALGCLTSSYANAAGPTVKAFSDGKGNAVLQAVSLTGTIVCQGVVPLSSVAATPAPTAAPAPAIPPAGALLGTRSVH